MKFDPQNPVVKLCAKGIEIEGTGDIDTAKEYYQSAWQLAATNEERFIVAHYLARNQPLDEQLKWNQLSLDYALEIDTPEIRATYPSLYLNLGKSYEEVGDMYMALENYQLADDNIKYLADDGYGKMIKSGIASALERVRDL